MTSRDDRETRSGRLDAMIRWTLRESVAGAAPPPTAWREICERAGRESARARGARWRDLRLACRSMVIWLVQTTMGPRTGFPYPGSAEYVQLQGRYGLCLLMYQQDLTMLLGQVL